MLRVPVWPLTQREITGQTGRPGLFDRILRDGLDAAPSPPDPPDLPHYLELAAVGGLPPAVLSRNASYRRRWQESYLEQLVTRDAEGLNAGRDPVRLRRYLDVLAENTAGLPTDASLLEMGAFNSRTAASYDRLLQALGVLDILPAWSTNRIKRLTQRGKRRLTDTGLTAAALRVDAQDLLRDGALFGRFVDANVTSQIRAEIEVSDASPRLHHLRDRDDHEVDLLLDYGRRGVIAIEIKASAAPTRTDARHLLWLRHQIPNLLAGIVFHRSPHLRPGRPRGGPAHRRALALRHLGYSFRRITHLGTDRRRAPSRHRTQAVGFQKPPPQGSSGSSAPITTITGHREHSAEPPASAKVFAVPPVVSADEPARRVRDPEVSKSSRWREVLARTTQCEDLATCAWRESSHRDGLR